MVKIAIDAGHGGFGVTPGKRTPAGEYEWDFNNKVAIAAINRLKQYKGVQILRLDDPSGKTDISLTTRTNKANNWGADILVSFHHNANTGVWGSWTGTETYTYNGSHPKAEKLARAVQNNVLKAYGLRDRGLKKANFHMLRESGMPAILVEGGYMDSNIDIKKLRNNKVLENAGHKAADGMVEYFGLKKGSSSYTPPKSTPSKPSQNTSKPSTGGSIVDWMKSKGMNSSYSNRVKLAKQYGIKGYSGSPKDNTTLLAKLKAGKPSTGSSASGSLKSKVNGLRFYNKPSWSDKDVVGTVNKGIGFPTIVKKMKVGNGHQYQVKNSKGAIYYITASSKYVTTSGKSSSKPKPKAPSYKVGSKVKIKSTAKKYTTGENIPARFKGKSYTIQQVKGNQILLKELYSWAYKKDLK